MNLQNPDFLWWRDNLDDHTTQTLRSEFESMLLENDYPRVGIEEVDDGWDEYLYECWANC